MKNTNISEINKALLEIVWQFGPKGLDGECCGNLSLVEFYALNKIATTVGCAIKDIGDELGFTKSGATRIVNRLKGKGFIDKIKSDEDSRICCVAITYQGLAALESIDTLYSSRLEKYLEKISTDNAKKIKKSLLTLAELIK